MAQSLTEICNLALSELAARSITSYESDTTVEAQTCRLHLPRVIDSLLRRHQWNFAIQRKALSRLADDPLSEWGAAWQLPSDLVRYIRISSSDPNNPVRSFSIEGRKLLTNTFDVTEIVYISNSVNVTEWDSLFVDAITLKLASKIAGPITKNPQLAANMLQQFEQLALPQAQTADAREVLSGENFGPRQLASMSGLVNARFSNSGIPFIPAP